MIFDFFGGSERRRNLTAGDKNYLIRVSRGKCEYCGKDIIGKGITPNIHHIVPFASRGSDSVHNLIVLCPDCHSMVDQIPKEKLRAKIAYRLSRNVAVDNPAKRAVVAKKTTSKKTAAKKVTAKKSTSKRTKAKKASTSKTVRKRATAKKSTTRKTMRKKTAAKKSTTRKTTRKKTTARKSR